MLNDAVARRTKVEVDIYGYQYLLAAGEDAEYVRRLAADVDARMRRVSEDNPHLGPVRVSILMLLGLASDLEKAREAIEKQQESLAARCCEIEQDIEQLLGVA